MVTPSVRLVRPLRDGGMGSVWVAEHLGLQTEVVAKFISAELAHNSEAIARFEREAAAAAQVKSPHVVQVFDHGVSAEYGPYIVMELLVGEDLGSYLKHQIRLPAREVAALIGQVAKALARAHAVGIIHRDIKPDNIFLCDADGGEAFVKLLDFGIAKAADRIGSGTTTGQVLGTPFYMSPEQLLAEPIDARTDIWSLGVVAFEAVTGTRPFKGETMGALTMQIHSTLPTPSALAPDVPAAFDGWFRRACCKDRDARFPNVREAAQALYDACLEAPREPKQLFSARPPMMSIDLGVGSMADIDRPRTELSSSSATAPVAKRDRRSTVAIIAGAAVLVAIGVTAFGWTRVTAEPKDPGARPATNPPPTAGGREVSVSWGAQPVATAVPPSQTTPSADADVAVAPSTRLVPTTVPSAPSAAKSAKPPHPRHPPPLRPRDGFDDIK